jgi:glucose/arabinose dehydrogenase
MRLAPLIAVLVSLAAAAPAAAVEPTPRVRMDYRVEVVTSQVSTPWAIAFLPDGTMLVTEKGGTLRRLTRAGVLSAPITGVPAVSTAGQGGLLDVAVHPNFSSNRFIYLTYSAAGTGGTGTVLARAKLSADFKSLTGRVTMFTQAPRYSNSSNHYGSRIVLDGQGYIYVSLGDRAQYPPTDTAQRLNNHVGKVIRITEGAALPPDNPFYNTPNAYRANYTYGHRNPQGIALHPTTGEIWEIEHGPLGGDELNILKPGANYGWPVVSWGRNYDGTPVGTGQTSAPGMTASIFHWDPVIAPGGMTFYTSNAFPRWKGNLFIAGLRSMALVRLTLDGNRVVSEERLLTERGQRLRDVQVGPDGYLYVATDASPGQILRVVPTP